LAFAHHNFEVPDERNYIMGQICEAATKTGDIQVKAFECLVRIAQLYYFIIEEYLSTFLGNIIKNALTSDNTDLVHQAVEFWSTMNDSEIELKQNMEYYDDEDINVQYDNATGHRNIVVRSLPLFVPEILTLMVDDDEDVEEDEWTVAKAAATCLRLTAQNVCDQLLSHVGDFIIGNIESQEWAKREAAVMALGTVMDGPSIESLLPFIDGSLNLLSKLINDPSAKVKDSAVWTLSQICLVASEFLASKGLIQDIVGAFLNTLSGEPSIVTHACSGLIALGEQINCDETAQSSPLSHIYKDTLETLAKFTSNNAYNPRTLTSAYEAISSWARKCPEDCLDITRDIYMEMLARLTSLTELYRDPNNSNNLTRLTELQSNVCVVMTSLIRRIGPQIALVSDQTMVALFAIIDASNKNTTAAEDVFITISAIITVMGPDFERYLEQFHPLLCLALQNPSAPQLTSISIGIVGDLARSLQTSFAKYSADYMTLLGGLLSSSNVDTSIKPTILSTFGDIAQAICEQYQPYIAPTVEKLLQAKNSLDGQTSLMDPDALACAILDAYTGMIQGLHVNGYANFFHEFVQYPVDFLHTFSQTMDSYEEYVLRRAVGLIGDLCEAYSDSDAGNMLKQEFIARIVKYARTRRGPDSEQTRLLARWAKDKMKRIGAY
jgi:importin subunit beta-1